MKYLFAFLMMFALLACEETETEYVKIKDVYSGELSTGEHNFTFNMIEAGDFILTAELSTFNINKAFTVVNSFQKSDTTNTQGPTGSPADVSTLSINKSEFLVDETITAELKLITAENVKLIVSKKIN